MRIPIISPSTKSWCSICTTYVCNRCSYSLWIEVTFNNSNCRSSSCVIVVAISSIVVVIRYRNCWTYLINCKLFACDCSINIWITLEYITCSIFALDRECVIIIYSIADGCCMFSIITIACSCCMSPIRNLYCTSSKSF